ncbi:chromatin assembly factor 1 subunit A-A-like isoform X1 [Sebastes umbrosus]|uniref:chromatin assembly factor 1 subunit A-A-like isoform X1 n=1 Tax=Sebastes umbrosus TaxID=72105 RepID=UPI0018A074DF|nr:chromatin assembly factor 1 subunit A-A-like isoform X1 [Sebastes umbrosus]
MERRRRQEKEMAKGKAKINRSVSLAPPQPRSLRSRKRECPSDEISETDDVQATHHQDTEGNGAAVDATLLQCHQCPLQESTMTSTQQPEAADESCLTKQDPDTEEKHAEATNVTVKAFEEQEQTTVDSPNNDPQLEGFRVHADNDVNKSGKDTEEMTAEECNRSPSQTCTDLLQVFLPISEEGDGAALEEQLSAMENSHCHLEKKQEASQEEPSDVDMADVKEVTAGLPAKKKRRMGMCGLTERERSHFLQTQKRENEQNGPERVEKQICDNTADLVAQEEIKSSSSSSPSIPVGSVTEQDGAEMKLQSSHCGGEDRAETEVHIAATTSDGTSAVSDPGCSKGKSCEVEGGIVPGPEQTDDTKSDPPAQEELLGNQEQQECEGGTAEIVAEKPQEQMRGGEDGSAAVDQSPAITFYSHLTKNEETENQDAIEAVLPQVNSVTGTRDEKKEELTGDAADEDGAQAGASSTDTRSEEFNAVELCKAAATPGGSERKDSCDSDGEPGAGPSTVHAEPPHTSDTTDPFGSGYLDYVSDSQLNTIVLNEEEVEREEDLDSPDHEDATDLICGLIRELSSLNRKVMATHRELENLRRSSKSLRSSIR